MSVGHDAAPVPAGSGLLCIYYKVAQDGHAALLRSVRRFQQTQREAWPGLACELLRRPGAIHGIETWMETYRHPGAAPETLAAALAQAAALAGLPEPRHAELFVPFAPTAGASMPGT